MAAAADASAVVVPPLDDEQLQGVYTWLDSVPLSRPKRNCTRDFSDGVLMAEVIAHYFPKLVQMHNYSAANSTKQKMYNWSTLSQKVMRRMKFDLSEKEIEAIVNCVPNVVEYVLMRLQARISEIKSRRAAKGATGASTGSSTMRSSAGRAGASMPGAAMSAVGADPMGASAASGAGRGHAHASAGPARGGGSDPREETALLVEKEQRIQELEETNEYLELKIKKLEQLVRLKDNRIATLQARVASTRDGLA